MPDLSSQLLSKLNNHRLGELPVDDDMILPYYDGLSLVNIPGTVCQLLDTPGFGKPPLDPLILDALGGPYEKVILLLVDALGERLFKNMLQTHAGLVWNKYYEQAVYATLTSICPSTTASALTTLWTGEGASVHGIVGFEMWAKEFGMIINNIVHSAASAFGDPGGLVRSGFDPHTFIQKPLLGTHLKENDVQATAFIHARIAGSGLSVMQMEDVHVRTYLDEADLGVNLADYVNQRPGIREYIYVYYSDVDTLMHRYSAEDLRVSLQFDAFSNVFEKAFLERISPAAAKNALLILTADHGSIATGKNPSYDLASHPDLLNCLVMKPTCENRLAFLYIKPEKEGQVRDYFKRTWPDAFYLLKPQDALDCGLFGEGPFRENVIERLGDLVVVARGDAYLWWSARPNLLAGRHGGLSAEEMLIPFYGLPLGMLS